MQNYSFIYIIKCSKSVYYKIIYLVAHHAAAVPGRRPLGQETAFAVCVRQACLHPGVLRRIDEVQQREERAERVPEPGVGVHVSGQHLAVVGAVMHRAAVGGDFVEFAREERRTVEARVEGAVLLLGAALDLDASQHLVPALLRTGLHLVEVGIADLGVEVAHGLLRGDERRSDARRNLLAAARGEVHLGSGMVALGRLAAIGIEEPAAGPIAAEVVGQLHGRERLVEADDEPVAEVLGHAAAVARGVARYGAVVDDLHARSAVEGVDDDAAFIAFGEREAQHRGAVRRGELDPHVAVGQVDLIIIGPRLLALVREPAAAALLVDFVPAAHGHQRKLPVVVDPRRGLVGLLEAADRVRTVGIGPSVAHPAGLGRPEVHAPRKGCGRVGVARRERVVGLRAHERRDVLRGAELRLLGGLVGACGQSEKR